MTTKGQKITYWTATILLAFVLVGSGMAKLSGGEQAEEIAKNVGGMGHVTLLGILEVLIAAIWIPKRTGVLGFLLGTAYFGGAIAVHFVSGQSPMAPMIIQALLWIAAVIRFPELLSRIKGSVATAE